MCNLIRTSILCFLIASASIAFAQEQSADQPAAPAQAADGQDAATSDTSLFDQDRERIETFDRSLSPVQRLFGSYWDQELFTAGKQTWRLGDLIAAGIVFGAAFALFSILRMTLVAAIGRRIERRAKATATVLDDALGAAFQATRHWLILFFALYLGLRTLPLPSAAAVALDGLALILGLMQVAIWANAAFVKAIEQTRARRLAEDPSAASAVGVLSFFGRIIIWSGVILLALDNLGFNITTLIAGLGVGGVAIAFALQNILGDIFCSVAILLDKPFVVGDFIIVGELMGSVERIGIKTTRLRSLSGEQIVCSNADLLSSRIRNYKRMYERRVLFSFGVVYETPTEKLERIPGMVRDVIEGIDSTRFDRAHFQGFGDFSLNFEVVYFVLVADYNVFMDIQQTINLELKRHFERDGIVFAYPTQELIIRPNQSPEA